MKSARSRAGVLAAAIIVGAALLTPVYGATEIPPMLLAAVHQREADLAGYTVFDRVRTQSLRFPGHSETRLLEVSRARRGAIVFSVVVRKFTKNGDDVGPDERAAFQAELNKSPILETAYELPISSNSFVFKVAIVP